MWGHRLLLGSEELNPGYGDTLICSEEKQEAGRVGKNWQNGSQLEAVGYGSEGY